MALTQTRNRQVYIDCWAIFAYLLLYLAFNAAALFPSPRVQLFWTKKKLVESFDLNILLIVVVIVDWSKTPNVYIVEVHLI